MTDRSNSSIVIVGGGASGVILAAHLLQSSQSDLRVTLIEKRSTFGRGVAYSTNLPDHLLNVSALGMSAIADDPEHFARWLNARNPSRSGEAPVFAPRGVYGDYLGDMLAGLEAAEKQRGRLRLIQEEALSVVPTSSGVEVRLGNGTSVVAHAAVLAVGHDEGPAPDLPGAVRMGAAEDTPVDPDARILILGTGLSMVDAFLTLDSRGHRGEIVAVSRRGLLPSPHRPGKPIRLDSADIPLGTDLSYFVGWFRDLVRATAKAGGNWRDVVDGLRPFNQRIWQSWPVSARRRFLTHTKAWWDIHRHRMAPEIHERVSNAVRRGRIRLLAARLTGVAPRDGAFEVTLQRRHSREVDRLAVARIYDCTGIAKDVSMGSIRVITDLIARGLARPDPLRLGLDVTPECAVIAANGAASDRLFAIGPLTRGTFFEIDAVPDIRRQAADLAARLTA